VSIPNSHETTAPTTDMTTATTTAVGRSTIVTPGTANDTPSSAAPSTR
jgi:hypothetical protein